MKQYVGVDIVEISRIEEAMARWGIRFLRRIYTDSELAICGNKPESLAVRFAGKEAVIKALSSGDIHLGWKEIEILAEPDGKPYIVLRGEARKQSLCLGLSALAISLSHSRNNAVAFTVGLADQLDKMNRLI